MERQGPAVEVQPPSEIKVRKIVSQTQTKSSCTDIVTGTQVRREIEVLSE